MAMRWAKGRVPGAVGAALWVLMGMGAAAQEVDLSQPLKVEECVRVALGESPAIGAAEAQVQQAGGAARMAMNAFLPTLSVGGGWGKEKTSSQYIADVYVDSSTTVERLYTQRREGYGGQIQAAARQMLLDLEGIEGYRSSQAALAAAQLDVDDTRDQVELNVRNSFYVCLASVKLVDVEERALALAREQLRRAETLFNLGSVARSDVLQAKVNLADAELNLINRRNLVRVEHSRLALYMGLDPRIDLQVDTTVVIPPEDPQGEIEGWISQALEKRPDVRAGKQRVQAAELNEKGAKYGRLPTLDASAGWSRGANSIENWDLSDALYSTGWSLQLGFSLVLFDGMAREGRIQSAVGQKRAQWEYFDQLVKEATLEVKDSFLTIQKERESLRAAREGVGLAEESLRLQQALYESGAGTMLEWDNARLDLRRAQVSLIQAALNLIQAHLRFEKAVGN